MRCTALLLLAALASASDWPNPLGPTYDHAVAETGLGDRAPRVVWRTRLQPGYAGFTVAGGSCYTTVMEDGYTLEDYRGICAFGQLSRPAKDGPLLNLAVVALDAATGAERWRHRLQAEPSFKILDWQVKTGDKLIDGPAKDYFGPKAPPTVDGDALFFMEHTGIVQCLDAATGSLRWQRNLRTELGGVPARYGYSVAPIVVGKAVVCPLYADDAVLVALDRDSGTLLWKGGKQEAIRWDGYVHLVLDTIAGKQQIIHYTGSGVMGVDPADGTMLWRFLHKRTTGESIAAPLVWNDHVIISSMYVGGTRVVDPLAQPQPTQKTFSKYAGTRMGNVVLWNDHIFTSHGSYEKAEVRCIRLADGEMTWGQACERPGIEPDKPIKPMSQLLRTSDGRLIGLQANGEVWIAPAAADGFRELQRLVVNDDSQVRSDWWPLPAVADGRLYIRNIAGQAVCVDLIGTP